MGILGKNYDNEIMELNNKTNELSKATDKNKSDIILFANDVTELKETMNDLLTRYNNMSKEYYEMKKLIDDLKNEQKYEIELKEQNVDILTCTDVCKKLSLKKLNQTSLKYYLYEIGLLTLNINKHLNTYKVVPDYEKINPKIGKYMHIKGRAITFDKDALIFFNEHIEQLKESVERYLRKQSQFKESKQHLSTLEIKNYQDEIGLICGVNKNGNKYDASKWAAIYKRYEVDHNGWLKKYYLWVDQFLKDNPDYQYSKPSRVTYLVQEVGDGDVLLKIACELFVD